MPKCFWQEVLATEELLKVTLGWSTLEDLHENITSWACLDKSRLNENLHGTMCTLSYRLIQIEKQRHYPKEENKVKKYKSNEVQLI